MALFGKSIKDRYDNKTRKGDHVQMVRFGDERIGTITSLTRCGNNRAYIKFDDDVIEKHWSTAFKKF